MIFAGEPSLLFHSGRAVMERGGSLLHFSHPRIPSSVTARFLLYRDRSHLRCDGGSRGSSRCPRKSMLIDGFRSFPCWGASYQAMYNALHKSQFSMRVLSSCEPQKASMNGMEISRNKYLIDCEEDQPCAVGGIVALGKFDALHIGHRELAIQASKVGIPFLLSFAGIAEVLGWESRPTIVAKCDRKRIISSWAPYCGNVAPLEYQIDFSTVRSLTPRQFVERLSKELQVAGVVAGKNYRFGYRASGDAQDLVRLCEEYGLSAHIVSPVMDRRCSHNGARISINSSDLGQVSSTRVRHALAMRDMEYVAELLGRKHRLVLMQTSGEYKFAENMIMVPKSCMLNQPPDDGEFSNCTLLLDDVSVGFCRVVIDSKSIRIELESENPSTVNLVQEGQLIEIEFG